MSHCGAKFDLKNTTGVNTSEFARKVDSASLKSDVDKLDFGKLETYPTDLNKLSNLTENDITKKTVYDELFKKVNAVLRLLNYWY